MLKARTEQQATFPLESFNAFNKAIFHDEKIPPDTFTPLTDTAAHHITQAELAHTIHHHFKANKSSGLSAMPLELLKYLGNKGIGCMAAFLNASAIN